MWNFLAMTYPDLIRTIQRKDRVLYETPRLEYCPPSKLPRRAFRPYRKDHG